MCIHKWPIGFQNIFTVQNICPLRLGGLGLKIYLFFRVPASRHTNSDEADFNDGLGYGFLTVRWSGALVGLVPFDCVPPAPPPVPE